MGIKKREENNFKEQKQNSDVRFNNSHYLKILWMLIEFHDFGHYNYVVSKHSDSFYYYLFFFCFTVIYLPVTRPLIGFRLSILFMQTHCTKCINVSHMFRTIETD